ncbi:Hypothetical predicted protein [Olea europaea subsp. europaea]|uniref:Uncharacterized protein n=1 Tax=Olea europaea subsp. europaea TaxID=158383 RepID=A0A8S0QDU0_OLEEU|nr:Hypothetical predicted protein [Olea europaea subsp. europaea]
MLCFCFALWLTGYYLMKHDFNNQMTKDADKKGSATFPKIIDVMLVEFVLHCAEPAPGERARLRVLAPPESSVATGLAASSCAQRLTAQKAKTLGQLVPHPVTLQFPFEALAPVVAGGGDRVSPVCEVLGVNLRPATDSEATGKAEQPAMCIGDW